MSLVRLLAVVALASACAATRPSPAPARPPPPDPLPSPPTMVGTELSADAALERALARLQRLGFAFEVTVRPEEPGKPSPPKAVARTNRLVRKAQDAEPSCSGTTEILQLWAQPIPTGSVLRLACYTARLAPPAPDAIECRQTAEPGCPRLGDRTLGEIALSVIAR